MSLGKKENKVNANSGDQEKNLWKNGGKPEEKDGRTAALSPSSTIVGPGSKKFRFRETGSVDVIAEVFNLFNIANLTYASSAENIYSSGFGQPNTRIGNAFGSGGPRVGQFALRFSF